MYCSPYYGTDDDESGHLDFLNWLDEFCENPIEAQMMEFFTSKPKDERTLLILDGYDERSRRINDGFGK